MSHDNFNFDLVIVDNASNRLDFRRLTYAAEKSGIKTTIMRLNRNAGGSARNFGIRAARENASDYVLLMDSDTIVSDRDALKTLVDRASRSSADEVAFGPTVYVAGSKGEVWASGAQFPDLNDTTRYDNEKYKYVDFFPSAAVMIKASAFEKIGMFDDRFFIYYEDTDWFMRAADNGLKSVLVPGAGIDHAIGKGFGGGRFNAQRIYHSTRGRILFMKKYGDINDPKKLIRLLLSVAKSILGSIVISRSIEGAKAAIKATYDGLVEQYPEYESVRPKTIPLVVPAPTPTGKSYEYNIRDILLTFVRRMASLGLLWLGMQTVGANGGKEAPAPAALPTSVTDKPQSNVRAISDSTPASGARKSIIDADEGLSAAEKQSLLDEAKRLQKISSQVDVPMPDGSVETLMVCRIGFAELDRATQELLRTRGIAGAYNITDAVTGTVYIFTDESLTDIDMAVRHEELEAAWRAILLRSPPDKKLLRRLSSVGRDPIERAAHILASASLQNMAFIRTQLNRPDITAEQLQSLLNEDRSLHRDVIWVYLSGMEEDNRRFEAGVRAEIRRTLQKPIPSSETPAPKPVRTGALEYAAAPDVATPGSDTVAKPISDVKTSMLDDVASLAKPETADDRSVIVRKMTEKVKKYGARQALNAVDRMIEKYLGQRADLEMALRTAVMVNGIGDIGKAEHLNIVVQIAGPGESNKARSPIQDIKNKLENYPYNIYAQSILEEGVDNQDNLKEVIDRLMTSLQDPANKDPRVLLLLPEHLHPYFNFAKDYLKANGINVDEPGAQVKIQKIEQGSDPDLVTQFGLGFEIIEYDRLTDEAKKDENNYRGLLDLLAAMADGQDPKDILNDLFKGILKIRKINWQSAVEQRKSWEAVARSL